MLPNACPKPPKSAKRGPQERAPRKQKTRMKQRNAKRQGHMFPKNVSQERRAYIRGLPCVLDGRYRPLGSFAGIGAVESHHCTSKTRVCHLKSRGSGGKDAGNIWPGCDAAHEEQHRLGVPAFEERWNINLAHECARHELFYQWLGEVGGTPEPR